MRKIDRTGLEIADALLSLLVVASTEANMPCAAVTHLGELAPDYTHLYLKVANAFACIQNCPRTVLQRIKPLLYFPLKGSLFIPAADHHAAVMHQSTTVLYMRSHPQEEALGSKQSYNAAAHEMVCWSDEKATMALGNQTSMMTV